VLTRTVRAFLAEPRVARLATIGRDGYPHIVTIWFMRDGDDIMFGSSRGERKVANALRNPKAAVVIGGDPASDRAGYMIQGDISVEDDPKLATSRRLIRRYEPADRAEDRLAEFAASGSVLLRLKPRSVIRVW
jgi:PPOX class probable F420-dependent enzyme